MKLRFLAALAMATLSMSTISSVLADDSKSYTEGVVKQVTAIRIKPGMFDAYMKWLDTTGKQIRDDEKKAGLIVDYAVYQAQPRSPHDPDLYLVITYKNMAALDGLSDRIEPLQKKIWGTREAAAKASADRESMREVLGSELVRQLDLK
ncbi:MAG TPA: hypothetical protein VNZ53_36160 [Steroidobacteraceae bacterium]|jgi:hypothetical protein|nr:hypothetical protein [Steroidobacteraceae bacterium]